MRKTMLVMVLVALAAGCSSKQSAAPDRTFRIGYMVCNSEKETLSRFEPLTAYLGAKLGVKMEAVAIDTVDFPRQAANLDFTHTNSLLYIVLHRNHGVEVLAGEKAGQYGTRAKGAIAVLKTSAIHSLRDLKGKSMIFGPMLGPTSYMAQLDLLLNSGIDPDRDLSLYAIPPGSYKHEKNIYAVLYGKYDAGAFPMLDFERMVRDGKVEREDFRIIAESEAMPYCTFGVTQRVDDALARKFKQALLELGPGDTATVNGEVLKVLDRAQVDGYSSVSDSDYDGVREMAKRTNMPPFQKY